MRAVLAATHCTWVSPRTGAGIPPGCPTSPTLVSPHETTVPAEVIATMCSDPMASRVIPSTSQLAPEVRTPGEHLPTSAKRIRRIAGARHGGDVTQSRDLERGVRGHRVPCAKAESTTEAPAERPCLDRAVRFDQVSALPCRDQLTAGRRPRTAPQHQRHESQHRQRLAPAENRSAHGCISRRRNGIGIRRQALHSGRHRLQSGPATGPGRIMDYREICAGCRERDSLTVSSKAARARFQRIACMRSRRVAPVACRGAWPRPAIRRAGVIDSPAPSLTTPSRPTSGQPAAPGSRVDRNALCP